MNEQKIPTTFAMDGLFTEDDIKNRHTVMFQCKLCKKWTKHDNWTPGGKNTHLPCTECNKTSYDSTSIKSLRTYNPLVDNKRKVK